MLLYPVLVIKYTCLEPPEVVDLVLLSVNISSFKRAPMAVDLSGQCFARSCHEVDFVLHNVTC